MPETLPRWGPMLSPRVPNLVPIPGPRMERETPRQRRRPNCGHLHVTVTQTAADLLAALHGAIDAAEALLDRPLVEECADPRTGEIVPLVVVTDNGPAMKSVATAGWFAARPHLSHVRTRHRSPHTNGVVERWFESLKYERLYREDIASGLELADCAADFINEYNTVRPHQALDHQRPLDAYLDDRTLKQNPPRSEQES